MAYWDTPCLLKLYAPEVESAVFRAHALRGTRLATSVIGRLELRAALHREESVGDLYPGGAGRAVAAYDADVASGLIDISDLGPTVVARFQSVVEQCYRRLPPLPIRTLDAIHLSTAVVCGELELVATDNRLREAALSYGLSVYPIP